MLLIRIRDPGSGALLTPGSGSVADPGCLSRIPDPDFYPSRIPDPGSRIPDPGSKTATKDRGEKIFCQTIFVATNFPKLNIILFLTCWRKKFGPIFQELLKFLSKRLSPGPQKYGFGIRDPRSGIRKKPIPDPESRGQKGTGSRIPDPGSRIRIRNTGIRDRKTNILYIETRMYQSPVLIVLDCFENHAAF